MTARNARVAVEKLADFMRRHHLEEASLNHIAAEFKSETRGSVPFILRDVSDARRFIKTQPLTQPLLKEIPVETKKVVGIGATKPLPVQVKPGHIATVPQPKLTAVPPEPLQPPPPAVKSIEPRLLFAPTGDVVACTTANLSESVDEFSQQVRCDPSAIVVYRPVKVRVQRLVEVTEE